jgi:hypothetical protein
MKIDEYFFENLVRKFKVHENLTRITGTSHKTYVPGVQFKVDRSLSREYFTSDAIYNGSAGMTSYY